MNTETRRSLNLTFIFIGWLIEFALTSANHQSNPNLSMIWVKDNKAAHRKKIINHTDDRDVSITNFPPQPNLSTEVSNRDIVINDLVVTASMSSTTPSGYVHIRPSRNRTVFSPRGPPNQWDPQNLVSHTTTESDLQNSTFVGLLTGGTIVFMLVWLPCYLYSETCLRGRSDNVSQGSSENLNEDLEADDHPPSYNEALSSRTVSTFSFTAQGEDPPPPSYDSLNVLIQDIDKTVCRVTSSTSYYSYRPSTQTARVSSSRSFHGTSSQYASSSLYKTTKKLSSIYKGCVAVRSLSFNEQPTLAEIQLENYAGHSSESAEDPVGTTGPSESDDSHGQAHLQINNSKDEDKLDDHSIEVFSNIPNYPPPTYREECGSPPSRDSSSLLTVFEVNGESDSMQSSLFAARPIGVEDEDSDENIVIMRV